MKKRYFQKLLVSIIAVTMILAGSIATVFAANPSGYQSLHGDFGPAPISTGYYIMPGITVSGYMQKFRVFVPPGAFSVSLAIYEYGNQTAIARHETPPTTVSIPADYYNTASRTLDQLQGSDQIISENKEGKITIIYQQVAGSVSLDQAGWLYVYVTGGSPSAVYNHKYQIWVDAKIYNEWRADYGTDPAGGLNWSNDVEGVTTYLSPSPLPAKPLASPQTGTIWNSAPQYITVTSSNASMIVGSVTSTTGDSVPPVPEAPTSTSPLNNNNGGASWTLPVNAIDPTGITRYKCRFMGINSYGSGIVSDTVEYTVDLTAYTPAAVTANPGSGTTVRTSPLNVTVSSANATQIYYTYSTDGITPPAVPDRTNGYVVTGPSATIPLAGYTGQSTTYKVLFRAFNQNKFDQTGDGWGETSLEHVYTLDLRPVPPDSVAVSTPSGAWTSAPQYVQISSAGATVIRASYLTTIDGFEPEDPPEPTALSPVVVTGSAGNYLVPSNVGKMTRTKVRFIGYNADGFGPAPTTIYSYSVELPSAGAVPGTAVASPTSGAWTDANHQISVSSSGANYIYVQMTTSTDGTEPAEPQNPIGIGAIRLTGGSGSVTLPSAAGKKTLIKMKAAGSNDGGLGPVSPTYSYSIELPAAGTVPALPVVNPTTGAWTDANHQISVSSSGATLIYVQMSTTTDGSEPANPQEPINGLGATRLSGSTGTVTVPSTTDKITRVKMQFGGYNATGLGKTTPVYAYSIDLRPKYGYGDTLTQTQAAASPGTDVTAIVTKPDGTTDPTLKFYLVDPAVTAPTSNLTQSMSVADLVLDYLKTTYKDQSFSIEVDGNGVMIITANCLGSTVVPGFTGALVTTTDGNSLYMTVTGDIVIVNKGIAIKLYPASADQASFDSGLQAYGLTVEYGSDKVMQVGNSDLRLSLRFDNTAQEKTVVNKPLIGDVNVVESESAAPACEFIRKPDGNIAAIYPDGTSQVIPPYIHDPGLFKDAMAASSTAFDIDACTGEIRIYGVVNTQPVVLWKGLPDYQVYSPPDIGSSEQILQTVGDVNGDGIPDMLFTTKQANQIIFSHY